MVSKEQNAETVKEIELLITYGVEENERSKGLDFLMKVRGNRVALTLLKDFYSTLPGELEEPVVRLALLVSRQGVFLLGVATLCHEYLYFASEEKAGCLGPYKDGPQDPEVLTFFGLTNNEEFQKRFPDLTRLQDFGTASAKESVVCPVCFVSEGENHHLGCAVEICPWCDAQLNRCNCRFDKLETEEIETEKELAEFERLLEDKGRICFEKGQAPAYPLDRKSPNGGGKTK